MNKAKKYYLGFKDGSFQRFISISISTVNKLIADGYEMFGFDNELGIPTNPIIDNGEVRSMTEAEITAQTAANETARQVAKPDNLKQAENAFLSLVVSIPAAVGIAMGDNSAAIKTKLLAYYTDDKTSALEIAVDLLNAIHEVEINGGSWSDLPTEPHNLGD